MTCCRTRVIGLALACALLAHKAEGQGVVPGDRVRVVQVQGGRVLLRGTLVRRNADSATILSESAGSTGGTNESTVAISRGNRLERSAGQVASTARGVGMGLLVGAATGALLGAVTYRPPDCTSALICLDYGRGFSAMGGAIVLTPIGMVIGGIVGANHKHEAWKRLAQFPFSVSVAPTARHRVVLRAGVSF